MIDQPIAIFLVGLPGCGKSYFRNNLLEYVGFNLNNPFYVISSDDKIDTIASVLDMTYNDVFEDTIKLCTKSMNKEFDRVVDFGGNLLIDKTNLSVKTRKNLINRLPLTYRCYAAIIEKPPEDVWRERLNRPGKIIPEDVLINMKHGYEPVRYEEGFERIYSVEWNKEFDFSKIFS